jgi:hypothetical protein
MKHGRPSLTPRLKPLSPRKSAVLSVLDIGTTKVVCLVARLDPVAESDLLRGRTHRARIIGIGHQRARGLKGGAIVDLEAAEQAIRLAVDAAERMAKVEIRAAIVTMTGEVNERTVTLRHALRNAALPLATVVGVNLGHVFAGAIIVETIFSMPGMGLYFFNALTTRDVYPVMAWLMVTATLALAFNLLTDILYGVLDPRIRT